jgi:hypothetical protein
MAGSLFGWEWSVIDAGILLMIVLFAALLVPYLVKEIREGKREFGPLRRLGRGRVAPGPVTPSGTGDVNPGRTGDPAPGQPDGRSNPYGERAQRHAPHVKS